MCKTTTRLKSIVDDKGLLYVASMLGHEDTVTLKRWLKGGIPKLHLVGVEAILDKHEATNE